MNAEQLFLVNEFVKKYATRNVWNVSDELFKLAAELTVNKENNNNSLLPAEQCVE